MSAQASTSAVPEPEIIDLTGIDEDEDDAVINNEGEDESGSEDGSELSSDNSDLQLNQDSRSQLYLALSAVPEAQIREILKQLIEQVPAVEYALTKKLVGKKKRRLSGQLPRRRRLEVCSKCQEAFDADEERSKEECCFHPGFFRPDYSKFVDWDEDVHGTIDSEDIRREYPENYQWTCCQEYGDTKGCVRGPHQPAHPHKKRREH